MNLLAIDTSTEVAGVALSKGADIYGLEQEGVRQHAQFLLPMTQSLMQEHNITWDALQGIVFNAGPGSFTGLRIACSIAKALAYAHDLPIFGITSMEVLAYQARAKTSVGVLAAGDARMQEVYWAYYPPHAVLTAIEIQVSPVHSIQISDANPIVLAGWGLEHYHQQWPTSLQTQFIDHYEMYPKAETLIRIVQSEQRKPTSAENALPFYVRNQVTHSGETHG
ncbi:MAG: tRNA (adenosine(37)-N6)-threonylcarbamoyltransferase complex dimerization subunit type 1 TsaB [Gammaproteobacteria bacterium]